MTWPNIKLNKALQQIEDVILFGSSVRGKEKPGDTDVLVLFKAKVDKEAEYLVRKELEKNFKNVSIISKTVNSVYESTFDAREAFLFEGVSLVSKKKIADKFGFTAWGLFKYNFKNWNKLTKTKFYYALNGRGSSVGILSQLGGIKLSDEMILIHLDKIEPLKDFLASWKCSYQYFPILLPERFNKKNILEQ